MKAWSLHGIDDLRLETVEIPILGDREVLVEVRAVGICGSDIPRIYQNGTYSFHKDFQKQMAVKLGLPEDFYCDSRVQDPGQWLTERTGGAGVDVFFECVGKNETLAWAIEYTAPAGKVMLVGNPFSDMNLEKAVYWKILRNQLTVTGTWNSSFSYPQNDKKAECRQDDWNYVLNKLVDRRIAPRALITHRFPLEELDQGLHIMRDKTEDYIKIMGCLD